MSLQVSDDTTLPLDLGTCPPAIGLAHRASYEGMTRKERFVRDARRRFRSTPTLPGAALRRMISASGICERFARCMTLILAALFVVYGVVVYKTPVALAYNTVGLETGMSFLCGGVDHRRDGDCIDEWMEIVAEVYETILPSRSNPAVPEISDGLRYRLTLPNFARLGLVTIGFTGLVFCGLGVIMMLMLCLRKPGPVRLCVKCSQLCLGSLLSLYLGLTCLALYGGRWMTASNTKTTPWVATAPTATVLLASASDDFFGPEQYFDIWVDYLNLSHTVTTNRTGVFISNQKVGCLLPRPYAEKRGVQRPQRSKELLMSRDEVSGSEQTQECYGISVGMYRETCYQVLVVFDYRHS